MNTLAALIVLRGYAVATRRAVRERYGDNDVGASTLELVIIVLGLIAVATLLVVATSSVGNRSGCEDGSSTSWAKSTARAAASGRRAHHR